MTTDELENLRREFAQMTPEEHAAIAKAMLEGTVKYARKKEESSYPRVSDKQLDAWFTVVVKIKTELLKVKRFLNGPLTKFHKSPLAEIREREERRNQIE